MDFFFFFFEVLALNSWPTCLIYAEDTKFSFFSSITKQPSTEPCLTHPLQWIFYKDAKISSFSVCNQMHTVLQGFKEEI